MALHRWQTAIVRWILAPGLFLLFLELFSFLVNSWYDRYLASGSASGQAELYESEGVDQAELEADIETLYGTDAQHHPYRAFALKPNYKSRYTQIDHLGFRNDRTEWVSARPEIVGFFGGSTVFSVKTPQDSSIPALFQKSLDHTAVQSVNYGVGGYSSSDHIMTLIEILRHGENLKYAIFYDGVNEAGRFAEYIQSGSTAPVYRVLGHPFPQATYYSLLNFWRLPTQRKLFMQIPPLLRQSNVILLLRRAYFFLAPSSGYRKLQKLSITEDDYEEFSSTIASIYLSNMRDLAAVATAHGIKPIFVLQPQIYSLTRTLSDREAALRNHGENVVPSYGRLITLSYRRIRLEASKANLHLLDLSYALDDLEGFEYFFDDVHLTRAANEHVAKRIMREIRPLLPQRYIRKRFEPADLGI